MIRGSNILSKLKEFNESTYRLDPLEHLTSQLTQKNGAGPGKIFNDQLRNRPEVFENLTITSSENFNSRNENSQICSYRGFSSRISNSRETYQSNLEEPRITMVSNFHEDSRIHTIRDEMMNSNMTEFIIPSLNGESILQSIRGESLD